MMVLCADASIDRFRAYVGATAGLTLQDIAGELATIQTFSALRVADRVVIYVGAMFDENAVQRNAIHAHKDALAALAQNDSRLLIAAMEWFCGVRYPQLVRRFPVLLKHLYDEDLVEEDKFFEWETEGMENEYSSPSLDAETLVELHTAAVPFLIWLREAEEDDNEEEEEEEEDDESA